jgi:hypothetical protein
VHPGARAGGGSTFSFGVAAAARVTTLVVLVLALTLPSAASGAGASAGTTTRTTATAPAPTPQTFTSAAAQTAYFNTLLTSLSSATAQGAPAQQAALQLVSGSVSALSAPTSLLDDSAAAGIRAQLLAAVAAMTTAATTTASASAPDTDTLTALASAVTALTSDASQLNAAGAGAALGILASVASAGAAVSAVTGGAVVSGLASLASAAVTSAASAPSSGAVSRASVLPQVVSIVETLASSVQAGWQATPRVPGEPPAVPVYFSSAVMQLLTQVDEAPDADSRLYGLPFSAPGSASLFAPLPAGLFGGVGVGVQTLFASFAFDPHNTSDLTAWVTRLAFAAAPGGAPIEVSNLEAPIYFTLPPLLTPLPAGTTPGCVFWDAAAGAYSTAGCVSMPYMRPPGHTLAWVPGFRTNGDAAMAAAWNISGPLVELCHSAVLDCSMDANGKQASTAPLWNLWPDYDDDRTSWLSGPAIGCSADDTSAKRIFGGQNCTLIQPGNAANCYWDNLHQVWEESGLRARLAAFVRCL